MNRTLVDDLQTHLDELEKHINIVPDRIRAYYTEGEEQPNNLSEFETPPHQQIINRGISAIEFALEFQQNEGVELTIEWGLRDIEYTHLGIGLDLILQGIFLKYSQDRFLKEMGDNGETPDYDTVKNHLLGILSVEYPEQKTQIRLTLKAIRKHRNNSVHLGFHDLHNVAILLSGYEVAGYLIRQHSEDKLDIVCQIKEHRDQQREHFVTGHPPEHPLPLDIPR